MKMKYKKSNKNRSHAVPRFVTLTINSNAFYLFNNHYINFSMLNGNAKY